MEQIHNQLMESSQAYSEWHERPAHKTVHWVIAIAAAFVVGIILLRGVENWRNTVFGFVTTDFSARSAILSLEPATASVRVGQTFAVNIVVDTAGKPVDGVDIYSLQYDPILLSVIDDNPTKPGTQITPGNALDVTTINSANASTGDIQFGQTATAGTEFTGKGTLATIHFKTRSAGKAITKFDFKLGSTSDTNVANAGRDQLSGVINAEYTVSN